MKMNKKLEKVCRFLIENKIANEDLANIIKAMLANFVINYI